MNTRTHAGTPRQRRGYAANPTHTPANVRNTAAALWRLVDDPATDWGREARLWRYVRRQQGRRRDAARREATKRAA